MTFNLAEFCSWMTIYFITFNLAECCIRVSVLLKYQDLDLMWPGMEYVCNRQLLLKVSTLPRPCALGLNRLCPIHLLWTLFCMCPPLLGLSVSFIWSYAMWSQRSAQESAQTSYHPNGLIWRQWWPWTSLVFLSETSRTFYDLLWWKEWGLLSEVPWYLCWNIPFWV